MKKLNLLTYVNAELPDEKALVSNADGEIDVLVKGDYYHDKILEKIEGFLGGLDYAGVEYNFNDYRILIDHNSAYYSIIGFERQDFDDEDDFE